MIKRQRELSSLWVEGKISYQGFKLEVKEVIKSVGEKQKRLSKLWIGGKKSSKVGDWEEKGSLEED